MGPAQSLFQAPLQILSWVGLIVLPIALVRSRHHRLKETWLGVVILWGGVGVLQLTLALSEPGRPLGLGTLVLGLALLVGLHRSLWRPRQAGLGELRRVAILLLPGACLAVAAMSLTKAALGWSELDSLRRTFESTLAQLPLVVSDRVALVVTYSGLWCLAAWGFPERWRVSEPPLELSSEESSPEAD